MFDSLSEYDVVKKGLEVRFETHRKDEQGVRDLADEMLTLRRKNQETVAQETVSAVHAFLETITKWDFDISDPICLLSLSIGDDETAIMPLMQLHEGPEDRYIVYMRTMEGDRVTLYLDGEEIKADYRAGSGDCEEINTTLQGESARVLTNVVRSAGMCVMTRRTVSVKRSQARNYTETEFPEYSLKPERFADQMFEALTPYLEP